jgi:hypothetical protein
MRNDVRVPEPAVLAQFTTVRPAGEEGVRYRAIGCGYTSPARRLDAAGIAKAYGATVTVAFVGARKLSDLA